MKRLAIGLILAVLTGQVWANDQTSSTTPATSQSATKPAVIYTSIDQILKVAPAGVVPVKAATWTEIKADVANAAMAEKVHGQRAKLKLIVQEVPHWDGWLIYSCADLPQGFPVRVFAHFRDEDKAKLGVLNKGDVVVVSGTFNAKTKIEMLWHVWGVSINLDNCDFSK